MGSYFMDYMSTVKEPGDSIYWRPRGYSNSYNQLKEPVNPVHLMSLFSFFSSEDNPSVLTQYYQASLALAVVLLPIRQLVPTSLNVVVGTLIYQTESILNILGLEQNLEVWKTILSSIVSSLMEEISGQTTDESRDGLSTGHLARKMSEDSRKVFTENQNKTICSLISALKALHSKILQSVSINRSAQANSLLQLLNTQVLPLMQISLISLSASPHTLSTMQILGNAIFFVLQTLPALEAPMLAQLLASLGLEQLSELFASCLCIWRTSKIDRVKDGEKAAFHEWFGPAVHKIRAKSGL